MSRSLLISHDSAKYEHASKLQYERQRVQVNSAIAEKEIVVVANALYLKIRTLSVGRS